MRERETQREWGLFKDQKKVERENGTSNSSREREFVVSMRTLEKVNATV